MSSPAFSRTPLLVALVLSTLVIGIPAARAQGPSIDGPLPLPLPLLPPDNWWNVDVSQAPLDPNSQAFITHIGTTRRLHPDWAGSAHEPDDPDLIYGIPYVSVPGTQPLVPVHWTAYGDQSDDGAPGRPPGYPIPEQIKTQPGWMEGGAPAGSTSDLDSASGDRHLLIVDRDNRILYELYNTRWNGAAGRWEADSGAIFPMTTNHRRPDTWTSADAAGLAMLPGLVRYDEAFGTEPIRHAFRVTVRNTNGYVFPASHRAGNTAGALPMGARLRLKASVDISGHPAQVQRVLQAMKTYGLIVADNGSDMFITGTSDPRWDGQMDPFLSAFHNSLNASMFEVVQLGWQPTVVPDSDGDGLPSTWETQFGLNPDSASGEHGGSGDPDGDGQTNAQEFAGGTHPRGFHTRYFAEGVSNGFFTTRIAAANPGSTPTRVLFRFLRADGAIVPHVVDVAARGRITLDPTTVAGLGQGDYSTVIESDEQAVVDRTVSWDARGYGSHAEGSLAAPATTWYLAEGSTTWEFSLFYLLQNPSASATTATVRYLRPSGAPIVKSYGLPPNSRTTIQVASEDAALADTDVSAEITASAPIIAERAMYLDRAGQAFGAGHGSAGVTSADTTWFLAEGSTGPFFDLFILIANPSAEAALVEATYLLPDGSTRAKTYSVAANARHTIYVDAEEFEGGVRALADTALSVRLVSTNGVPVIVERTMWWPDGAWYETHNAPGSTETGTRWALAEGESGGETGTETYILIANTSAFEGDARVTLLFEGGGEETRTYRLPPNSRTNVPAGLDFPGAANRRFGAIVESLAVAPSTAATQIVVERAMYRTIDGVLWAAGTNAAATRLAP